jgi:hypothetical protein
LGDRDAVVLLALVQFAFAISFHFIPSGDWALLALPVVYVVSRADVSVPRWRWAFLTAYPLHLVVLWVVSRV